MICHSERSYYQHDFPEKSCPLGGDKLIVYLRLLKVKHNRIDVSEIRQVPLQRGGAVIVTRKLGLS